MRGAVSIEFVVTLVAVAIGAVLLGERLSTVQLIGGVVIIAGCSLVIGLVPRRRSPVVVAPPPIDLPDA